MTDRGDRTHCHCGHKWSDGSSRHVHAAHARVAELETVNSELVRLVRKLDTMIEWADQKNWNLAELIDLADFDVAAALEDTDGAAVSEQHFRARPSESTPTPGTVTELTDADQAVICVVGSTLQPDLRAVGDELARADSELLFQQHGFDWLD